MFSLLVRTLKEIPKCTIETKIQCDWNMTEKCKNKLEKILENYRCVRLLFISLNGNNFFRDWNKLSRGTKDFEQSKLMEKQIL